jgi:hypothetical protein
MVLVLPESGYGVAPDTLDASATGRAPCGRGAAAAGGPARAGRDRAARRSQPRRADQVEALPGGARPPRAAPAAPHGTSLAPDARPVATTPPRPATWRRGGRVRNHCPCTAWAPAGRWRGSPQWSRVASACSTTRAHSVARCAPGAGAGRCPLPARERDDALVAAWLKQDWPRIKRGLADLGGPSSSSMRRVTPSSRGWVPPGRQWAGHPSCVA